MKRPAPKNVAASVHARLKTLAAKEGVVLEYLLNRYAAERALYRLSKSPHRDRLVLKGATLFRVWEGPRHRPTRDVDLLGSGSSELSAAVALVRDICTTEVEEDGLVFPLDTIAATRIKEDQEYEGVRVKCHPRLGSAELHIQIDIGFGDDAQTEQRDYPPLLEGMPAATLRVYTRESVIAEKVQAMVHLDLANSRMKDFFDVRHLAAEFSFCLDALARALTATFARRGTPIPTELPIALTDAFAVDPTKMTQWSAFLRKGKLEAPPLTETVRVLAEFLGPVLSRARSPGVGEAASWAPGGPWVTRGSSAASSPPRGHSS